MFAAIFGPPKISLGGYKANTEKYNGIMESSFTSSTNDKIVARDTTFKACKTRGYQKPLTT